MGYALGRIHLSYDDFCRLSPDEFNSVCKVYVNREQAQYQDNWVRMRMLACITIQPHIKDKLTPQKLLPLSWEKKKRVKVKTGRISAKEAGKKRKEIIALLGEKY